MELPNYFFADLPPEATLSPAMITEACAVLKRNREKFLLPRRTNEIVKILCDVGDEWLRPESPFRRLALEQGPAETGFSRPVLERGLDDFFRRFTPGNFSTLLEQELGYAGRLDHFTEGTLANGPRLLVHVAAGNLPNPALMSLTLGLLTRSAQFMKCARGGAFIPRLFAHSIYEHDRKLGTCLELAEWRGGNAELETALFAEADTLTATGSDETLAAIRTRLPGRVRFLGYGQRVSFGLITREVLRDESIAEVVSRAADDVVAWDQNGCLSPHVLYVEERGVVESDQFAEKLAVELARREATEPRGKLPVEAAAAIASKRATYAALTPHRGDLKLWASPDSTAWTVVFEHEVRFRFSPLNRFVYVKPVPDLAAVMQGVDELAGQVSTVGIAAGPERSRELALHFARWGATRVCPLGRMQNPPLTWRHDGRPPLGDLITWTDYET
jgi:hypothetical protein